RWHDLCLKKRRGYCKAIYILSALLFDSAGVVRGVRLGGGRVPLRSISRDHRALTVDRENGRSGCSSPIVQGGQMFAAGVGDNYVGGRAGNLQGRNDPWVNPIFGRFDDR